MYQELIPLKRKQKPYIAGILIQKNSRPSHFLSIELNKIRKRLKKKASRTEKIREFFGSGSGNLTFKPSGLAVHPLTNEIYIIAHQGSIMVVFDQNLKIKNIYPLIPKIFKQPEGICFLPDGTLIISNEGVGGKANLLVFEYSN